MPDPPEVRSSSRYDWPLFVHWAPLPVSVAYLLADQRSVHIKCKEQLGTLRHLSRTGTVVLQSSSLRATLKLRLDICLAAIVRQLSVECACTINCACK